VQGWLSKTFTFWKAKNGARRGLITTTVFRRLFSRLFGKLQAGDSGEIIYGRWRVARHGRSCRRESQNWWEQPSLSWSQTGRAKEIPFTLDGVSADAIEISGRTIKGARKISRSDFEFVADRWDAYLDRQLRRYELNRSQNTTYILTILHWLDSN
jgi:hypothetical protein